MKKLKSLFLLVLISTALVSGCKKQDLFDPARQLEIDEQLIKNFISANNLAAVKDKNSAVYYVISAPGTGEVNYTANTRVKVKYTGRFLNGEVFDQNSTGATFTLGGLIYGWQIGIPLIKKGGKIRLLIPSGYAYGSQAQNGIPANSVLDFDIELEEIYQ